METPTTTTNRASNGENYYLHALLGAAVTFVTSFVPFSPLLGGAVAGYLQDAGTGHGTRVGAVSGVFAALPLAAAFFLMFTVMSFGSLASGEFVGPLFVVVMAGFVLLFAALYVVGLSAVGGYLGAAYAESRAEKRSYQASLDDAAPAAGTDDVDREA